MWRWAAYNPIKARPEELKFAVLDGNEKRIGELAYKSFELKMMAPKKITLMTLWGEAVIGYEKFVPIISLNGLELARLKGSILGREADFMFPGGTSMSFKSQKGKKNDIQFSDGNGGIGGFEEFGTLPEGTPGQSIQMSPEEIKRLPKDDRPRSIETRDFVQYRIMIFGALPVKEEDIVRTLCIFSSLGMLLDEMPK